MKRRIPLLWKYAGVTVFSLTLIMLGAMYGVRALDLPGCVTLIFNGFNGVSLYDLTSQRTVSPNIMLGFTVSSPDQSAYLYTKPRYRNADLYNLYLAHNDGSEHILFQEGVSSTSYVSSNNNVVMWSPDSSRFAYLWESETESFLSVANADGSHQQTVPLIDPITGEKPVNSGQLHGWSADNRYLTLSRNHFGSSRGEGLSYWAVEGLHQLPLWEAMRYWQGKWSNAGNLFAGVTRNQEANAELVIFSLDKQAEVTRIPLPDSQANYLSWSPDDRFLMVARLVQDDTRRSELAQRWQYDFYSVEGEPLHQIVGLSSFFDTIVGSPLRLTATWTGNGDGWLYLRENESNGLTLYMLSLTDGHIETIAENIISRYVQDIFSVPPNMILSGIGETAILPDAESLLLPTLTDGKIKFEIANLNGENRKTIVEAVDELVDVRRFGGSVMFRSYNSENVYIGWARGEGDARQVGLTIASPDGTMVHTLDTDLEDVKQLSETYNSSTVSYLGKRDDDYGFEVWNFETGEHQRLVTGLDGSSSWGWIRSPQGDSALLIIEPGSGYSGERKFHLIANGQPPRELGTAQLNYPAWSQDATSVAYVGKANKNQFDIEIVDLDGSVTAQIPLPTGLGQPMWLSTWSDCLMG